MWSLIEGEWIPCEDRDDPDTWGDDVIDEPEIPLAEGEGFVFAEGQEIED